VPSRRLTNSDLEKIVDTSDAWITERSGIKERRISADNEHSSDMSMAAIKKALEMAGLRPEDIDLLIIGTVTPDYRLPSTSCIVQKKLGLVNAATMDVVAACAGFLHALATADAFIKAGRFRRIVVVGVEKLTSITDYTDRNTCVLFGDGAGAAVVEPTEDERGVLGTFMKSNGNYADLLWIPDGGSINPLGNKNNGNANVYIKMNGREVFKHAVREMEKACRNVLDRSGLTTDDVTLLVPHQANIRIEEALAKRLNIPVEKVFINIAKYGNTSSASVPIALDEAYREGKIKENDIVLMTAFGGGLTWASALVKW